MPDRDPNAIFDTVRDEAFWRSYLDDPFAVRGLHQNDGYWIARTFQPGAEAVELVIDGENPIAMSNVGSGLFITALLQRNRYRLRTHWPGAMHEAEDPYTFGLILGDIDLHLFAEGTHWQLAEKLGAMPAAIDGVEGVAFAVWAPNAGRVSVVGDFNSWDDTRHPMRHRPEAGLWELFIPRLEAGERYKYAIVARNGEHLPYRADPVARETETPPATASVVAPRPDYSWNDGNWMAQRAARQSAKAPISIYEVHAASWRRPEGAPTGVLNWQGLADLLIPYVRELGFTHIELMPIMEHPFAGSWGYQPLSQFAPSARFGAPQDFARFVDACHREGIGIVLDWVPAHFPNDAHGLAHFDGTPLYEHSDPREGFHPDWNTHVYNLGRTEVQEFLIASALWWLERFHVDGLRVDAVASMLYRDYSRKAGEWIPNRYGGRENLEAIAFLKRLNGIVAQRCPGAMTIAEESTAWPGVTAPPDHDGLGFSFKWNMGWMHDTLRYLSHDPIHRPWHHNDFTFGLLYAFSERFILPLSHDEVVYGKGSLYARAPGDDWQKLATLRAYFTFMWTHPGKKLLFMGGEFAAVHEWNHDAQLDWPLLDNSGHAGVRRLIGDLNRLYAREPSLHESDADADGFEWIVGDDRQNSVFVYLRRNNNAAPLIVAVNMTPVPREGYRFGVPRGGTWREILNSDSNFYGGGNIGNGGRLEAEALPMHGREHALSVTLPPLATIVLKPEG